MDRKTRGGKIFSAWSTPFDVYKSAGMHVGVERMLDEPPKDASHNNSVGGLPVAGGLQEYAREPFDQVPYVPGEVHTHGQETPPQVAGESQAPVQEPSSPIRPGEELSNSVTRDVVDRVDTWCDDDRQLHGQHGMPIGGGEESSEGKQHKPKRQKVGMPNGTAKPSLCPIGGSNLPRVSSTRNQRKREKCKTRRPPVGETLRGRHMGNAKFHLHRANHNDWTPSNGCYIGRNCTKPITGEEPLYIPSVPQENVALVDENGIVFAARIAPPKGFEKVVEGVQEAIERFAAKCKEFKRETLTRGNFVSVMFGILYGGGQTQPMEKVQNNPSNREAINEFRADRWVVQLIKHAMNAWQTWNPGLKEYYQDYFDALLEKDPSLTPPFDGCPFFAAGVNCGPQTWCKPHLDHGNLPFGQCLIMPFGNFDWIKGGHLKLVEPNVTLEVRPGEIVFIPSASVTHSNTPIAAGETRYSITLFSPGFAFQYIDNCFQTQTRRTPLGKTFSNRHWTFGWNLYPKVPSTPKYTSLFK